MIAYIEGWHNSTTGQYENIEVEYTIHPGYSGGWETPGEPPYVEILSAMNMDNGEDRTAFITPDCLNVDVFEYA